MDTNPHTNFKLVLCIVAAICGCSSSDKGASSGVGGSGLGGGSASVAGSSAGGLGSVAGAGGVVPIAGSHAGGATPIAGSGAGGVVPVAGSGGAGLGLGGGSVAGNTGSPGGASGVGTSTASGGTFSQVGGSAAAVGGTAGSSSTSSSVNSTVVWSWGQQGNEGLLADPDWTVDNVQGAHEGTTSAHPPALLASTPVELTIDCGGQAHTELSFYLAKFSSAPNLDLLVDGVLRYPLRTSSTFSSFEKYLFDVPQATHTYTFRAESASDAASSFALDSIVCKMAKPAIASNATVDFDQGFIPPETGGSWLVDNLNTYSDGSTTADEASIHPPPLQANTPVDMTFNCGGQVHTELSFYLAKFSSAPNLDLLIDGVLRYPLRASYTFSSFEKYLFDVPQATHTYTFRAQSTSDAASSFAIDMLQCKNVTPAIASNATVDFDRGFIPPETGGSWLVDNLNTYSDGSTTTDEASIHPPPLQANTSVDMTFNCGQAVHSKLSFWLAKFTSAPTLDVLIDDTELLLNVSTSSTFSSFEKYLFDVPQATHTYTFRAQSTSDAASSFAVDFLYCAP